MVNMTANRSFYGTIFALLWCGSAVPLAADDCRLCSEHSVLDASQPRPDKAPVVDILSGLAFNRAAQNGKGNGKISVSTDGGSAVNGGLIDLGGSAVAGTAVIHGAPGRYVRIELPYKVEMKSANGGKIEISNLRTNLGISPQLDATGQLSFSFGGDLHVDGDMSGKFRGRIAITAQYE
jgi:hypothetical protein